MNRRTLALALAGVLSVAVFAWLLRRPELPARAPAASAPAAPANAVGRATLAVRVLSGQRPVAGARVTVGVDPAPPFRPIASALTDSEGRVELAGLAFGTRELLIVHPELASHRRPVELVAERVELTVTLERGVRIDGSVSDARGRPVAGVVVRALGETTDTEHGQASTDERGAFSITGLTVGSFRLYVRTGRHRPRVHGPIHLPDNGDAARADLVLEAGLTLSGRVVDAARAPVPGASVGSNDDGSALVTADEQGRFELAGLAPGQMNLFATAPGYAPVQLRGVRSGGRNFEIVLERAASLEAEIVLAAPARQLTAGVCRHDAHFGKEICVARRIYRPVESKIAFAELPVGEHVLVVEAEGHEPARIPVSLSPGQNFTVPRVTLVETTLSP